MKIWSASPQKVFPLAEARWIVRGRSGKGDLIVGFATPETRFPPWFKAAYEGGEEEELRCCVCARKLDIRLF